MLQLKNVSKSYGDVQAVSNLSLDGHHHRTFMEYALDWYIVYRNEDELKRLAEGIERSCVVKINHDSTGIVNFLEVQMGNKR